MWVWFGFFFFPFYTREFPLLFFFLLEREQGSRQAQAATWALAPVTEHAGPGGPSGTWGGGMWDRGPPRQRGRAWQGTARGGDGGRGPRGGLVTTPRSPRRRWHVAGAGWHVGDKVTDTGQPWARGGLQVTKTPSDPSQALGKGGSFQDPPHPQSSPCCQPSVSPGWGRWHLALPQLLLVTGGQIIPPGTPRTPSLVKEQPLPRWHRARGRGWWRGQGTAVPGGMERLLKARGAPAPPCMALEYLFEKTWHEM